MFFKIKLSQNKKKVWLGQLYMFDHFEKSIVSKLWGCDHETPGKSKFLIISPIDDSDKFSI